MNKEKNNNPIKIEEGREKDLAYGGQALIEGILMRSKKGFGFTVRKPDGSLYKEKTDYTSLSEKIKFLGLPFVRGIVGFFENMFIVLKVLNKSAEIAFPAEESNKKTSNVTIFLTFLLALMFAMVIFVGIPYFLPSLFKIKDNETPFLYNLIAGFFRFIFFFAYLFLISFLKDTQRLFSYHGAEHKTIHTYEKGEDLTIDNVKKSSRLHPRCGTSFVFIVFLITLFIFPFIDSLYINQEWFRALSNLDKLGRIIQKLIKLITHIFIGMPIVASISYELLKLSGKFYKNFLVKIFVAPGLFFQLFTTREPDDEMIKIGIISLNLILGKEDVNTPRKVTDEIFISNNKNSLASTLLLFPLYLFLIL